MLNYQVMSLSIFNVLNSRSVGELKPPRPHPWNRFSFYVVELVENYQKSVPVFPRREEIFPGCLLSQSAFFGERRGLFSVSLFYWWHPVVVRGMAVQSEVPECAVGFVLRRDLHEFRVGRN